LTGTSGRIATQLALNLAAQVVVAGRNQRVLDELVAGGAEVAIRVDQAHDELAAAIAAHGPFDVISDYLWGPPAETAFAALIQMARREDVEQAAEVRYIEVGMAAGEDAALPAIALRSAPVRLMGSGTGGRARLADAAVASHPKRSPHGLRPVSLAHSRRASVRLRR
jgi:NADPH:quinone reductase-like Zn-dependent oxidoreductase